MDSRENFFFYHQFEHPPHTHALVVLRQVDVRTTNSK